MKRFLLFFVIAGLLLGCSKKKVTNANPQKVIDSITRVAAHKRDTVREEDYSSAVEVNRPSVIFFMPDFEEQQRDYRFYGFYSKFQLEQIFRGFRRLYEVARPELLKDSINTMLTYHWKFRILTDSGYVDFDRKEQGELMGFILADTHSQPQIFYGLYRIKDFQQLIQKYFNIPDFQLKQIYQPTQAQPIQGNP